VARFTAWCKGAPPIRENLEQVGQKVANIQVLNKEVDMYNTILVPLDGSKRAEVILPHVEELARNYSATLIFLHVIEPVPLNVVLEGTFILVQEVFDRRTKNAGIYLDCLQEQYQRKGIDVRIYVSHGSVVEAILKIADSEDVDLIAMASHGRTGLSRVFYGSVAAGVLHSVDRPLLLIRSRDNE
jgi:nucleotide-binding universal stress UspA family protein